MPTRSFERVSGDSPLRKKRLGENLESAGLSAPPSLPPAVASDSNPNETITPHVDGAAKHTSVVTKSSSTDHPLSREDSNSKESFDPRALFNYLPCEGISQGINAKTLAIFVGGAMMTMGRDLMQAARPDAALSELEEMNEGDLAHRNKLVIRRVNGKIIIAASGCTGRATNTKNQDLLERAVRGHMRCAVCRKGADKGRRDIERICLSAENETAATQENIKFIATNPLKAEKEILSLREQVRELRSLVHRMEGGKRQESTDRNVLIEEVKGMMEVEIQKEKSIRKDGLVTLREMWLTHAKHMLSVFAADGNMRKVIHTVEQVKWSIVFHARTSKRVYSEASKLMKLPHISTIYRKGNEIVSSSSSRAYSLCTQTLASISRMADEQKWCENKRLVFIAMDSANAVEGLEWDHVRKEIIGGCQEYQSQPLRQFFNLIADSQQSDSNDGNEGDGVEYVGSIADNIKLAHEHCVAKISAVFPGLKLSEVIASTNCDQFSAEVVEQMIHLIHQSTPNWGLFGAGVTYDAANPNWNAVRACATHAVGKFLPKILMDKFPAIDFHGHLQIMVDVFGVPFVFIADGMHCCKANHTTLEKSSSPQSQRSLMYGSCPMSLKMIELVWRTLGGGTTQMQQTKLSELTFNRDSKSRMDCTETCRLLSNSTARMIKTAIEDDSVELGNFENKKVFYPLMWYIQHMNNLIDIMNGREGHYTPQNGLVMQEKLLAILDWFSKWKNDHDKRISDPDDYPDMKKSRTEYNFLAPITWDCLRNLILGHVFIIQYYCIERGFTIDPRTLNTDPVEQHFGNGRQFVGGSTHGLTARGWNHADQKAGLARMRGYGAVGNCQGSGEHFTKMEKF
eukprot:scaffold5653_cov95-Skeletonema_dohrnii-CCMP3373.AAC.7